MVEAGGIEPPSRDVSVDASTCVVRLLLSPRRAPADRIPSQPPRTYRSRSLPVGERSAASLLAVAHSGPRRLGPRDVTAYAAKANSVLAVVFCEVFYEAASQPRHAASTSNRPVDSIRPHSGVSRKRSPGASPSIHQYNPQGRPCQGVSTGGGPHADPGLAGRRSAGRTGQAVAIRPARARPARVHLRGSPAGGAGRRPRPNRCDPSAPEPENKGGLTLDRRGCRRYYSTRRLEAKDACDEKVRVGDEDEVRGSPLRSVVFLFRLRPGRALGRVPRMWCGALRPAGLRAFSLPGPGVNGEPRSGDDG